MAQNLSSLARKAIPEILATMFLIANATSAARGW